MAKITITLTDNDGAKKGTVNVVCDPSFEKLMKFVEDGRLPSPAEAFALQAIRTIHQQGKKNDQNEKHIIILPKQRRML